MGFHLHSSLPGRLLCCFALLHGFAAMAADQVLLRVTDENENPIPDCRIFWKSSATLDWQEPRITYRIGPNGVYGDGSVLARVRDVVPQAAEASRQLGDASINYSIIFNESRRGTYAVKVTAEGYGPSEVVVGETTPNGQRYQYAVVHLRAHRRPAERDASPAPSQSPEQGSYSATLYFVRSNNARAPNVEFKFIMTNTGYTVTGRSNGDGEASLTLPQYGPCKVIFYQPNGKQKEISDVIPMNAHKDITVLWW